MKTSEILFCAREIQLDRGRAFGMLEKYSGGPVCMLGAINLALHGRAGWPRNNGIDIYQDHIVAMVAAVVDAANEFTNYDTVARFSNNHCETVEDMAAALEIAACCAAAEGD